MNKKHLQFDNYRQETLFCVSSSLMCDGIHHCPPGDEYNSDEDPAMCARQRGISDSNVRLADLLSKKKNNIFNN